MYIFLLLAFVRASSAQACFTDGRSDWSLVPLVNQSAQLVHAHLVAHGRLQTRTRSLRNHSRSLAPASSVCVLVQSLRARLTLGNQDLVPLHCSTNSCAVFRTVFLRDRATLPQFATSIVLYFTDCWNLEASFTDFKGCVWSGSLGFLFSCSAIDIFWRLSAR